MLQIRDAEIFSLKEKLSRLQASIFIIKSYLDPAPLLMNSREKHLTNKKCINNAFDNRILGFIQKNNGTFFD